MELADTLRGRGGYAPARDERLGHSMQERDLWTGLAPFDFRSPLLLAEFYDCFAHMLRQIGAPPPARVLEYGPGSGQFLLSLARLGYQCHAVDIETEYLTLIERQARAMGLAIRGETGVFGEGFEGERFDCIIFFEAFHHAKDFLQLLRRLRQRLNPGGRLILCGEPIFPGGVTDGPIPIPGARASTPCPSRPSSAAGWNWASSSISCWRRWSAPAGTPPFSTTRRHSAPT
jgi:SAM-dependent methyltransferase